MKHSSEDLLGFVLGALDADQHDELQQRLDREPLLEQRLLEVKHSLTPLELLDESAGFRPGLARRTCEMVAGCGNEATTPVSVCSGSKSDIRDSLVPATSWSRNDFVFAVASIGILSAMLLPVVSYTRYQSQIAECGNNLRRVGLALASYSECNEGNLIDIPPYGPLAFFGAYAPILKEGQFVDDDSMFRCAAVQHDSPMEIPSIEQFTMISAGPKYDRLKRKAGGDYGYSCGYFDNDRYCPPQNAGSSHRILCADKPSSKWVGGPSENHGGRGQNCLLEDGSVDFVVGSARGDDSIFVNAYNIVGPGIGSRDSVIGASEIRPTRWNPCGEPLISE